MHIFPEILTHCFYGGGVRQGGQLAVPAMTAITGGQKGGGVVEEEDDSESWDMYLRTAEDQEKIKIEWESENKDWIESQVPECCICVGVGVLCIYEIAHNRITRI